MICNHGIKEAIEVYPLDGSKLLVNSQYFLKINLHYYLYILQFILEYQIRFTKLVNGVYKIQK